jgi:hypothetical protein
MGRIKIKDLNVNLEELKKKDPEILKKIRGGAYFSPGLNAVTVVCNTLGCRGDFTQEFIYTPTMYPKL